MQSRAAEKSADSSQDANFIAPAQAHPIGLACVPNSAETAKRLRKLPATLNRFSEDRIEGSTGDIPVFVMTPVDTVQMTATPRRTRTDRMRLQARLPSPAPIPSALAFTRHNSELCRKCRLAAELRGSNSAAPRNRNAVGASARHDRTRSFRSEKARQGSRRTDLRRPNACRKA